MQKGIVFNIFKLPTMKTKLTILFLTAVLISFGQEDIVSKAKSENRLSEVSGANNCYYLIKEGRYNVLINKTSTLMFKDSDFDRYEYAMGYVTVNGMSKVDSLINKYFVGHIKKNEQRKRSTHIRVELYSDMEGNLREIKTAYPDEIEISAGEYELFEKDLLALGVRFEFDIQHSYFKNSIWVKKIFYFPLYIITTRPLNEWRR